MNWLINRMYRKQPLNRGQTQMNLLDVIIDDSSSRKRNSRVRRQGWIAIASTLVQQHINHAVQPTVAWTECATQFFWWDLACVSLVQLNNQDVETFSRDDARFVGRAAQITLPDGWLGHCCRWLSYGFCCRRDFRLWNDHRCCRLSTSAISIGWNLTYDDRKHHWRANHLTGIGRHLLHPALLLLKQLLLLQELLLLHLLLVLQNGDFLETMMLLLPLMTPASCRCSGQVQTGQFVIGAAARITAAGRVTVTRSALAARATRTTTGTIVFFTLQIVSTRGKTTRGSWTASRTTVAAAAAVAVSRRLWTRHRTAASMVRSTSNSSTRAFIFDNTWIKGNTFGVFEGRSQLWRTSGIVEPTNGFRAHDRRATFFIRMVMVRRSAAKTVETTRSRFCRWSTNFRFATKRRFVQRAEKSSQIFVGCRLMQTIGITCGQMCCTTMLDELFRLFVVARLLRNGRRVDSSNWVVRPRHWT